MDAGSPTALFRIDWFGEELASPGVLGVSGLPGAAKRSLHKRIAHPSFC
jgi:hypothetical protein